MLGRATVSDSATNGLCHREADNVSERGMDKTDDWFLYTSIPSV